MSIITASYRITTPMFLSGADQNQAELRLPSFKGALRFWWRALAAQRFGGDIRKIRAAEDKLFGSTKAASKIQMRLIQTDNATTTEKGKVLRERNKPVGPGARYFGYGVMEAFASRNKGTEAGQLTRPCINAGASFEVSLRCRNLDDDEVEYLSLALQALGLLGGLGSKSRKGYGSLMLESLMNADEQTWHMPSNSNELESAIKSLHQRNQLTRLPDYTALSQFSRHIIVSGNDQETGLDLLNRIGCEMVRFRSWGHNGKVLNGENAERNFKADHDLMKLEPGKRKTHPARIAFGLPHNYGKHSDQQIPPPPKRPNDLTRRASPLLVHIHECDGRAFAILSFLPASFLPAGENGRINVGGKSVPLTPHPKIWAPVDAFLDRLTTGNGREKPFAQVLEVRP